MASILDVERNFGTNSVISTPFGRVCCFLNVVRLLFGFYSDCLALSGCRLAAISVLFLEFGRDFAAVLVIWEVFGRDWGCYVVAISPRFLLFDDIWVLCRHLLTLFLLFGRSFADTPTMWMVFGRYVGFILVILCYLVAIWLLSLLFDAIWDVTWT